MSTICSNKTTEFLIDDSYNVIITDIYHKTEYKLGQPENAPLPPPTCSLNSTDIDVQYNETLPFKGAKNIIGNIIDKIKKDFTHKNIELNYDYDSVGDTLYTLHISHTSPTDSSDIIATTAAPTTASTVATTASTTTLSKFTNTFSESVNIVIYYNLNNIDITNQINNIINTIKTPEEFKQLITTKSKQFQYSFTDYVELHHVGQFIFILLVIAFVLYALYNLNKSIVKS